MDEKWYKGIYRRNLVDMHIADWSEEFLSKFNVDEYYQNLVRAKINSPMIYLQSHTGLCHYLTKSAKTHKFFEKNPDVLNRLIDKCKGGGMKVVGYYSLIFNNQAVIDHPEWEMINADKTTWRDHGQRYGLCCPNNLEYREFLQKQIAELGEQFRELDGIFYDMPYWEMLCHCPSCKARWKREVGGEMPLREDWTAPVWLTFVKKRQEWMAEFAHYVRNLSLKYLPFATVELNFAAVIGCDWLAGSTEGINEACEFTGGDLYGDLYNHSFTCKYYYTISKNQPFEYMTCRCNKKLREHTVSKSDTELESEIMLTASHHGASLVIDAINPNGTLDRRAYERLGRVFKKQIPYEKYMDKGVAYGEVGVFFDSTTQFFSDNKPNNKQCAIRAVRTLVESHTPVRVLANGALDDLKNYKVIVAPALFSFSNPEIEKFIDYVKCGGVLYLSGGSDERLIKEFFDGKIVGKTYGDSRYPRVYKGYDEVQAYVKPLGDYKEIFGEFNDEYPLPITYKLPVISYNRGEAKAVCVLPYTDPDNNEIFASIHSNPPSKIEGTPMILEVNYGKGKVVWSGACIESDERENFKDLFLSIICKHFISKFQIKASKYVECIPFQDGEVFYLNFVDLNFAYDEVEREVEITKIDGYSLYELLSGRKVQEVDGKYKDKFTKYRWYLLKKEGK